MAGGINVSSSGVSISTNGGVNTSASAGGTCCCECSTGKKCVQKWTLEWICNADDPNTGLPTGAGSDPVAGAKTCVANDFDMTFKQITRSGHHCVYVGYLPLGTCCTNTSDCTSQPDTATPAKANGCTPAFRADCFTCGDALTATIAGAENPVAGFEDQAVNGTYDLARDLIQDPSGCAWDGDRRVSGTEQSNSFGIARFFDGDSCGFWTANAFCSGCENGVAFGNGCYAFFFSFDVGSCPQDAGWAFDPILYYGDTGTWPGDGSTIQPFGSTYRACNGVGSLVIS